MNHLLENPAHVINLPYRPERMASAGRELSRAGIPFERVEAIDGPEITYDLLRERYAADIFRKRGAERDKHSIACCLSHHRALVQARASHHAAFIAEDDIAFPHAENTRMIFDQLAANLPDDWQVLLLGANLSRYEYITDGLYRVTHAACCHAYLARGEALDELIQLFAVPHAPPDVLWNRVLARGNAYALDPPLAVQRIDLCEPYKSATRRHASWWTDEDLEAFRA